jgi:hypothetical protein
MTIIDMTEIFFVKGGNFFYIYYINNIRNKK